MIVSEFSWLIAALITGVFLLDISLPSSWSVSQCYLLCILLTDRSKARLSPHVVAAACTVLILIACGASSNGVTLQSILMNHGTTILLCWIVASFVAKTTRSRRDRARLAADIEHQQAELHNEKALRLSESKYRTFIDHASDALFVYNDRGIVLDVNRQTCESLGYSKEEMIGKSPPFFAAKLDLGFLSELIAKLNAGERVSFESLHQHRSGTVFPVEVRICPFTVDGQRLALAIARDITERKQAEVELKSNRQRLEVLSRQLITTQEAERRHLAGQLHDEIGQRLTAVKMNLYRTQRTADVQLHPYLEENIEMVDQTIQQVRNLSLSLRPPQLDELGLVAALHWLIKFHARVGGIEEELDVDVDDVKIAADLSTVCFRIAQEALTNALRHGSPKTIRISLRVRDNELFLTIEDDGVGFDVDAARQRATNGASLGLLGMQERASLVNGHLTIESVIGQGTKIYSRFTLNFVAPNLMSNER